jgi:hypothetical protein
MGRGGIKDHGHLLVPSHVLHRTALLDLLDIHFNTIYAAFFLIIPCSVSIEYIREALKGSCEGVWGRFLVSAATYYYLISIFLYVFSFHLLSLLLGFGICWKLRTAFLDSKDRGICPVTLPNSQSTWTGHLQA